MKYDGYGGRLIWTAQILDFDVFVDFLFVILFGAANLFGLQYFSAMFFNNITFVLVKLMPSGGHNVGNEPSK